jgi:uncharacterized membrane protein YdjX (TVP38/TMEM64 family)
MQEMSRQAVARRLPIVLLLVAAVLGWVFFRDDLGFQALADHHQRLIALRDAHYALAALGFVAIYAALTLGSLPGALVMTVTGGLMFGLVPGMIFSASGALIGAVAVFLAARAGLGRDVAAGIARRGGKPAQVMAALRDNAWPVLLTLRLVPVVPFFLANLLPAFVGIGLPTFTLTTALGILPGAALYAALGQGLGEVLARGETPELASLARPELALPLLGLAALAALPLVFKLVNRWRGRA